MQVAFSMLFAPFKKQIQKLKKHTVFYRPLSKHSRPMNTVVGSCRVPLVQNDFS